MWGYQFLESSLQQNFNFGFSTHNSDILIHLSQWQYWWWFWFALVWVTYFYVIAFSVSKRVYTFNPVLNTSLRSHGKWGDFLIAIIPLSWCGNILVNSNFILRMIEWQNESSLFTLRIQGKQWYWVYKYDGNAAVMIDAAPKNVGHNRWLVNFGGESYQADSYYQALNLAAQLEAQKMYLTELNKVDTTGNALDSVSLLTNKIYSPVVKQNIKTPLHFFYKNYTSNFFSKYYQNRKSGGSSFFKKDSNVVEINNLIVNTNKLSKDIFKSRINQFPKLLLDNNTFYSLQNLNKSLIHHYDLVRIDDTQNYAGNSRYLLSDNYLILHEGILNQHTINLLSSNKNIKTPYLFTYKTSNSSVESKVLPTENYWGFRQKKYKRVKDFFFKPVYTYDPVTFEVNGVHDSLLQKKYIVNNDFQQINQLDVSSKTDAFVGVLSHRDSIDQVYSETTLDTQLKRITSDNNPYNYYYSLRLNKKRSEMLSVTLARRLLRTKRTLVLPAHVNITIITSSYDVVHSWFVPGLGLKLDCVPGRSTHHTFYIDNVGFYYGQCAEICGRYHHHMPIRLCAVPFEQFLVWWHTKGLPRTVRLFNDARIKSILNARRIKDPTIEITDALVEDTQKITQRQYVKYRYNF